MASPGYDSPTTVDLSALEYLTVENYHWPKPPPPQRPRLDDNERRRRHSECQKRFLARKRCQVRQLRNDVVKLELQCKLMKARRKTETLQQDQHQLLLQLDGLQNKANSVSDCPRASMVRVEEESVEAYVVASLNVDALMAELGPPLP